METKSVQRLEGCLATENKNILLYNRIYAILQNIYLSSNKVDLLFALDTCGLKKLKIYGKFFRKKSFSQMIQKCWL